MKQELNCWKFRKLNFLDSYSKLKIALGNNHVREWLAISREILIIACYNRFIYTMCLSRISESNEFTIYQCFFCFVSCTCTMCNNIPKVFDACNMYISKQHSFFGCKSLNLKFLIPWNFWNANSKSYPFMIKLFEWFFYSTSSKVLSELNL